MSGVNPNSSVITLYEYELKLQLKGRHWQNGQETCFSYVWGSLEDKWLAITVNTSSLVAA